MNKKLAQDRFFEKGLGQGYVKLNFRALNADSSKTVKATDFKFVVLFPREVRTWGFENFWKGVIASLIFGH